MTNVTYIYSRLLLGFLVIHVLLQSLDNSCIPDPNNSFCQQQAHPNSCMLGC